MRRFVPLVLLVLSLGVTPPAIAVTGSARVMKATEPSFDRFTNATASYPFFNDHYERMLVYAPYFDDKTSRYGGGWLYSDLYAIYRDGRVDGDLAVQHPDWLLRDANGRPLYINWECSGGVCPQYAADFGHPGFRAHWIARARAALAHGYKGLFIDDVNLDFRISDGSGRDAAPIDPRTGSPMSLAAWRTTMADFLEQIRAELPRVEIVHNAIWFAGRGAAATARQQAAADYVAIERGVNDGGLTRGNGPFGYERLLAFVDEVHALGAAVVFNSYTGDAAGREYNLASAFLVDAGEDLVASSSGTAPDDWWAGYDVALGPARGPRYVWNGLLRRDFARGYVLVNQPQAPTVTVDAGAGFRRVDGTLAGTVSLPPASGMVLTAPAEAPVPPTRTPAPTTPSQSPVASAPKLAPAAATGAKAAPAAARPATSGTGPAVAREPRRRGRRAKRARQRALHLRRTRADRRTHARALARARARHRGS